MLDDLVLYISEFGIQVTETYNLELRTQTLHSSLQPSAFGFQISGSKD